MNTRERRYLGCSQPPSAGSKPEAVARVSFVTPSGIVQHMDLDQSQALDLLSRLARRIQFAATPLSR